MFFIADLVYYFHIKLNLLAAVRPSKRCMVMRFSHSLNETALDGVT